ncbi:MAG: hypothetical protein SFY81_08835 [Verrucomicrobiota bacterium]|nr:hypothetical protein [Verrucomicrobiota bacterium]
MNTGRIESDLNDPVESIADQIEEGVRTGQYSLADLQRAIMDKTREAATTTDEYVHENPWTALGIAAGVGLVIGYLMSSRR